MESLHARASFSRESSELADHESTTRLTKTIRARVPIYRRYKVRLSADRPFFPISRPVLRMSYYSFEIVYQQPTQLSSEITGYKKNPRSSTQCSRNVKFSENVVKLMTCSMQVIR